MSDLIRRIQIAQRNAGEAAVIAHLKESGLAEDDKPETEKQDRAKWCQYVAGMVGAYLGMDVDDPRIEPIGKIIERRLCWLPNTEAQRAAAGGPTGAQSYVAPNQERNDE